MSANKENQEAEEQAERQSVASPRISSTGAGEDDGARPSHPAVQGYERSSWNDHHHFPFQGGVGHRPPADARSIASSAAADRDDKSIYDLETGALDAHTEEEEEEREDQEEEEEDVEEEPVEITLTQVQDDLHEVQLVSESSNVESAYTAISGPASLADVVEQLADQAVAGELSPRQAAAAIRTATAQQRGGAGEGAGEEAASPSAAGADAGTDAASALTIDGSDTASVSAWGAAHSSIAPSEEYWQQGGGGSATAAGTSASVGASAGAGAGSGTGGSSRAEADLMESVPLEAEPLPEVQDLAGEAEGAAQIAAAEGPAGPAPEGARQEEEGAGEQAADAQQGAGAQSAAASGREQQAEVQGEGDSSGEEVPRTASNYKSQLMQNLTAVASEDDITVYSAADVALPQQQQQQASPAQEKQQPEAAAGTPLGNGAAPAAAGAAAAGKGSHMEPLSVEGSAGLASSVTMSTDDTAMALAAINAAAGPAASGKAAAAAPTGEPQPPKEQQQPALLFPPVWYETFRGLLYMDGVDALGRPVVVLNADAVPPNMKSSALIFVKAHLEPLVNQGDYVLVLTSRGQAKLSSMWIMGAYRSLPRPFRKHVQYIVLVRPSAFLRAVLAIMRPLVSKKAGRKIKQVQSVHDIAAATDGEVTVQSLGAAFAADMAAAEGSAGDASP